MSFDRAFYFWTSSRASALARSPATFQPLFELSHNDDPYSNKPLNTFLTMIARMC